MMPSREFFIRQAVLNVWSARARRSMLYCHRNSCVPPLVADAVRTEYSRLISTYTDGPVP